jgi:hypothetical protein
LPETALHRLQREKNVAETTLPPKLLIAAITRAQRNPLALASKSNSCLLLGATVELEDAQLAPLKLVVDAFHGSRASMLICRTTQRLMYSPSTAVLQ